MFALSSCLSVVFPEPLGPANILKRFFGTDAYSPTTNLSLFLLIRTTFPFSKNATERPREKWWATAFFPIISATRANILSSSVSLRNPYETDIVFARSFFAIVFILFNLCNIIALSSRILNKVCQPVK